MIYIEPTLISKVQISR